MKGPSMRTFACILAALCLGCSAFELEGTGAVEPMDIVAPADDDAIIASYAPEPGPERLPEGPLVLDVSAAIARALANSRALVSERLNPSLAATQVDEARAAFDPTLKAELSSSSQRAQRLARFGSGTETQKTETEKAEVGVGLSLPTGTQLEATASTEIVDSSLYQDDFVTTRAGLTITQALLRGASIDANLAALRQARIDVISSRYELRGYAARLVADVENALWDYALAARKIEIFQAGLDVAASQLKETETRIELGAIGPADRYAAVAELAQRRQELIDARADKDRARLELLRLIQPQDGGAATELQLSVKPTAPRARLEPVTVHIAIARRLRPDLNQAKLQVQRGELEITRTRNGLLPKLDLFASLGQSGYSDAIGDANRDLGNSNYDVQLGLRLELPVGNRAARALHQRARITRQQAQEALTNLGQMIDFEVRKAYLEVERSAAKVEATRATLTARRQSLASEQEKFRAGSSTSLQVAQAQRDFITSQVDVVDATTLNIKALVELYRLEGSLLERRGIAAPGGEPVELDLERG